MIIIKWISENAHTGRLHVGAPVRSAFPAKAVLAPVAFNMLAAVGFLNRTKTPIAVFRRECFKHIAFKVRKLQVFEKCREKICAENLLVERIRKFGAAGTAL